MIFEDFLRVGMGGTFPKQPPRRAACPAVFNPGRRRIKSNHCRNFPNAERVPTVLHADIVSAEDKRLHPQMPTDKINVSAHCANTTAHARQGEQHRPKPHRPPLGKVQEEGNESQVQQQLFSLLKSEGRFAALSQATVRRFLLW